MARPRGLEKICARVSLHSTRIRIVPFVFDDDLLDLCGMMTLLPLQQRVYQARILAGPTLLIFEVIPSRF